MKICILFLYVTLFSFSLIAAEHPENIEEIINRLSKDANDALLNSNFDKLGSFYTEDAYIMPPLASPVTGSEAIIKTLKEFKKNHDLKYHTMQGKILDLWTGADLVYTVTQFSYSYSTKYSQGQEAVLCSGMTIWQKQKNGDYRIKYDIWNLDYNPFSK